MTKTSGGYIGSNKFIIKGKKDCSNALTPVKTETNKYIEFNNSPKQVLIDKGYESFFKTEIDEGCEV